MTSEEITAAIKNTIAHLHSSQHCLEKLLGYHELEHPHNPWLAGNKPVFQTIHRLLRDKVGLANWPILQQRTGTELVLPTVLRDIELWRDALEKLREDLGDYHSDYPRLTRTLTQPVRAQLELASGHLRLAWCGLANLVEDDNVLYYTFPPFMYDGAGC